MEWFSFMGGFEAVARTAGCSSGMGQGARFFDFQEGGIIVVGAKGFDLRLGSDIDPECSSFIFLAAKGGRQPDERPESDRVRELLASTKPQCSRPASPELAW